MMMGDVSNIFSCQFLTLNVKGIRDKTKRERIFNWCKSKSVDIVCLQETYSSPDIEAKWQLEWGGKCIFSHGTNHGRGVLVLIDSKLDVEIGDTWVDRNGRYVLIKCNIQGQKLLLGNVYFPTGNNEGDQIQFLNDLSQLLYRNNSEGNPVVLCGDFNVIRDTNLDYFRQVSKKGNKIQ